MAAAAEVEPSRTLADYLTNPNAVLGDVDASWRYGRPPDYTKTRSFYSKTKVSKHAPGSLSDLVENLVKNWEIEASFKAELSDWRTINPEQYSFSINGREPLTGEEMLRIGTYNAIIQPGNEYYSPNNSTFAQSHKTFKRMMPTFAWEVLEVIGAPPVVGIKWRHWGVMKEDYVGFNDAGEKVTAKAHGGPIDLKGTTWAWVDDQVRVKRLETWFDPIEMFRQIAPNGIVNKETLQPKAINVRLPEQKSYETEGADGVAIAPIEASGNGNGHQHVSTNTDTTEDLTGGINGADGVAADHDDDATAIMQSEWPAAREPTAPSQAAALDVGNLQGHNSSHEHPKHALPEQLEDERQANSTGSLDSDLALLNVWPASGGDPPATCTTHTPVQATNSETAATAGYTQGKGSKLIDVSHREEHMNGVVDSVANLEEGSAIAVAPEDARTQQTHAEMSSITPLQCPFMNRE